MRDKLHSELELDPRETHIVDIQFAFNNKELLKLLTKRAKTLQTADFDKLKKIEKLIDEHKDLYFEDIRTPNTFFCTFERV